MCQFGNLYKKALRIAQGFGFLFSACFGLFVQRRDLNVVKFDVRAFPVESAGAEAEDTLLNARVVKRGDESAVYRDGENGAIGANFEVMPLARFNSFREVYPARIIVERFGEAFEGAFAAYSCAEGGSKALAQPKIDFVPLIRFSIHRL